MSTAEPRAPRNVGEAVLARVGRGGAMVFHLDGDAIRLEIDEVVARAAGHAARLAEMGVGPGDPVGLLGRNRPEWPTWAVAVWLAGGALLPLPAPVRVRDAEAYSLQIRSLLDGVGCQLVVVEPTYAEAVPEERRLAWNTHTSAQELPSSVDAAGDDTALVLCTSGSTSSPKGIRRTNATMLGLLGGFGMPSPLLSWLPLFHAAGLGSLTTPVFGGAECHVMAAEEFARDPASWFRTVGTTGAAATGGASSAFGAAAHAVARKPEGVDLSSLQLVMFVLEMVDPDVVDRVLEVCGPLGLRPETLCAAYGLSEGGGTATTFGGGIRIDTVDLEGLVSSRRAVAPIGDRPSKRIASCGRATPPTELVVGSPRDPLPERVVGELFFRSLGMMDGYVKHDAESPIEDGWLRTGDLGYVADGELFVTGRSKEIVVHFGRNYHPEDIEWAALRASGALADACVAFADPRGEEGAVIVLVEAEADDGLAARVSLGISNALGLLPREVRVVPSGAIPRAANGKMQRLAARDAFARNEFG